MHQIKIRPVDTFFFRNHQSMNIGEDAEASGIFPPHPQTVYGALRSAYIHRYSDFGTFCKGTDENLKAFAGTPEECGSFQIKGVLLYDQEKLYCPLPLDYLVKNQLEEGKQKAYSLRLKRDPDKNLSSDSSHWKLVSDRQEKTTSSDGIYVAMEEWKKTVVREMDASTSVEEVVVNTLDKWICSEVKVGIARNRLTGMSEEGMFYQMDFLRFRQEASKNETAGLSIITNTEGDSFKDISLLRLGGRNRPWLIESVSKTPKLISESMKKNIVNTIEETGIARIILLSPAIWKYGNRPSCWNEASNTLELGNNFSLEVVTAAVGRGHLVGGWDIVERRPKKRALAVSAGSVLYVKVPKDKVLSVVEAVEKHNWSDDLQNQGYGWVVCGC
ncbi:type III-B CRISPR module-associated protein Cmr3 [Tindallia californiensis]|uniref:CRISPR-associated protein Cmr3 n=1 Tax=Tindallia californiensis TaxID=159292 RepID=A0A1H3PQ21_9FIRM|nr:type III-B CRISPR module-associated protein Cmr3 [Tindallia californiensis]SDZ03093.1 CRISPR-associated protein Cmr3 [Tindallia californiensis]